MPDGYASNLSRCVDMREEKLFGMKSHDCHVFMVILVDRDGAARARGQRGQHAEGQ